MLRSCAIAEVLKGLGVDRDQPETRPSESCEFWIFFMISTVVINVTDWFYSKGLTVKVLKRREELAFI